VGHEGNRGGAVTGNRVGIRKEGGLERGYGRAFPHYQPPRIGSLAFGAV